MCKLNQMSLISKIIPIRYISPLFILKETNKLLKNYKNKLRKLRNERKRKTGYFKVKLSWAWPYVLIFKHRPI